MVSAKDVFLDYHLTDIISLIILLLVWHLLQKANPNRLYIPKNDPRCSYPHYNSGITENANLLICVIVPFIGYSILYAILKTKETFDIILPFDYIYLLVGHAGCIVISNIVSNFLKLQVGRPRPDFYSLMGQEANADSLMPDGMSTNRYRECFKSFPSGHTTTASCGMVFTSLFFRKVLKTNQFWAFFLMACPLLYAFYIAAGRVIEYRHHFEDVLCGLLIGLIFPVLFLANTESTLFTQFVKP